MVDWTSGITKHYYEDSRPLSVFELYIYIRYIFDPNVFISSRDIDQFLHEMGFRDTITKPSDLACNERYVWVKRIVFRSREDTNRALREYHTWNIYGGSINMFISYDDTQRYVVSELRDIYSDTQPIWKDVENNSTKFDNYYHPLSSYDEQKTLHEKYISDQIEILERKLVQSATSKKSK